MSGRCYQATTDYETIDGHSHLTHLKTDTRIQVLFPLADRENLPSSGLIDQYSVLFLSLP